MVSSDPPTAEHGLAITSYKLGRSYYDGIGASNECWIQAAEQGHVEAQFKLGTAYSKGKGVAKNLEEAAKWYKMAAEQGHAKAQFKLGTAHC